MTQEINEFLSMVADAKDRIIGLANNLEANHHRVEWSVEDDGEGDLHYRCRVQCTFGEHSNYHCGSYVDKTHPFAEAEKSIRRMHSEWKQHKQSADMRRQEEDIKQRLYEEYLAQKSSAK